MVLSFRLTSSKLIVFAVFKQTEAIYLHWKYDFHQFTQTLLHGLKSSYISSVNIPLSPPPKDHTVRPSCATATVWELPQATCPTPLMSFTSVGTFRLWLSLWPVRGGGETHDNRGCHRNARLERMRQMCTTVCTESAKVAFSPGIELSIISHSSAVSVASRHTNNNLAETA